MANLATQTLMSAFNMAGVQTTKSVKAVRKARRAYVGVHAAAYEAVTKRTGTAPKFSGIDFETLIARGTKIEDKFEDSVQGLFAKSPKFVRRATPCGVATTIGLMPKRGAKSVVDLETELADLNAELTGLTKAAKKTVKKTVKKAAQKVAPKTIAKKVADTPARHIAYWENVKAYDAAASEDIVRKIVNHCGIALNSKDAKFVACSDEVERNTVRDSWLVKKLGMEATSEVLDAKVMAVCEAMKADRMKCRVTFYYLLAKTEDKLAAL